MASSSVLAVGQTGSLRELKGRWLKHNIDHNNKVKVAGNHKQPQARYFSVCCHAPKTGWTPETCVCPAHMKAVGPSRESMTIVSLDLNHTCPGGDRIRNCMLKDMSTVSDVLDNCTATASREGNTKQPIDMTKASCGMSLKKGQASKAVRAKSSDTMEAQMGQFLWIPSLIDAYKELDPKGTYCHEYKQCSWDATLKQFVRCYICMSIAKHFWKHAGTKLFIADGAHTRATAFKHIVLIVVAFDANNNIIILAFATVDIEDANNWVWFKEKLDDDFPGWDAWMSDADKGIRSRPFRLSLSQGDEDTEVSRCTRHLSVNCAESCKSGSMNEDHRRQIVSLAKSRTKEVHETRLQALSNVNEDWARCLDGRKDEFVAYTFLDRGIVRWGKVTSNGVENINSALIDVRSLPIVCLIEGIVDYQRTNYLERQKQAGKWFEEGKILTHYCSSLDGLTAEDASKREVRIHSMNYPIYKARVATGVHSSFAGHVEAWVDVAQFISNCPCRFVEENGRVCAHVKALLLKLGSIGRDIKWFDRHYHLSTYKASYGAEVPVMALSGKLSVDETYLPPDHWNPGGRPAKKRRDRSHLNKTDVKRTCKACGKIGHFAFKCKKPDTEHRWKQHGQKAIEYCLCVQCDGMED